MHTSLASRLDIQYGDLVEVYSVTDTPAILQVFPPSAASSSIPDNGLAVHYRTKAFLGVMESAVTRCVNALGVLSWVSVCVTSLGEAIDAEIRQWNTTSNMADCVIPAALSNHGALLDRIDNILKDQLRMSFCYKGMGSVVRIGSHPVVCEISDMADGPVHFAGYISDITEFRVFFACHLDPFSKSKTESNVSKTFIDVAPTKNIHCISSHTLICGESGTGKTFYINQIVNAATSKGSTAFMFLPSSSGSNTTDYLCDLAHKCASTAATRGAPSLLVIDDIDTIVGSNAEEHHSVSTVSRVVATLRAIMQSYLTSDLLVLASAKAVECVPAELLGVAQFGESILPLYPPSMAYERLAILNNIFKDYPNLTLLPARITSSSLYTTTSSKSPIEYVAENSHGFHQRDLSNILVCAKSEAFTRSGTLEISEADLKLAARKVKPSVLGNTQATIPNVKWSDIGGSENAKAVLQECVEWCIGTQGWIFDSLRLSPPKGVLLYGPPGCSKTMLAKALANESKMNFVSVKGPEVFSKWVGDSEKAVRNIFRQARAAAPCVVFIDELDGMCGHRGAGGVGDRVISQLLTELDGLPAAISSKTDSIILVAATNRPDNIDHAVLRPGRIDRKIYVGLPNKEERRSIVKINLMNIPCDSTITPEVVASRTEGFTGAEVVAVCKEAAFQALSRSLSTEMIIIEDLEAGFDKVKPRIAAEDIQWYKSWGTLRLVQLMTPLYKDPPHA